MTTTGNSEMFMGSSNVRACIGSILCWLACQGSIASAGAIDLQIDALTGSWEAVTPATVTVTNTPGLASLRWGTPVASVSDPSQSGYDFAPAAPGTVRVGEAFRIGTFTHLNRRVNGPSLDAATLRLGARLALPGAASFEMADFLIDFDHIETANAPSDGTCFRTEAAPGSDGFGCPDFIDITRDMASRTVTTGGFVLSFGLEMPVLKLTTEEQLDTSFDLNARFDLVSRVPAPPALGLFATVLLAGLLRIRRSRLALRGHHRPGADFRPL
jgi:hypothetical protein